MQFTSSLRRAAQQRPNGMAIIHRERGKTYRQLESRVACLASGLLELGIKPGDVVALVGHANDRQLEAQYALAWAGAVAAPILPTLPLEALVQRMNRLQAVAAIIDDATLEHADALIDHCPFVRVLIFNGQGALPELAKSQEQLVIDADPIADSDTGGDAPLIVYFASALAGDASAVQLSHRNVCTASLLHAAEGAFADEAIGLVALPSGSSTHGLITAGLVNRAAAQVFIERFEAAAIHDAIYDHGVTDLALTTLLFGQLLAHAGDDWSPLSSLRRITYVGPTLPESLIAQMNDRLPNTGLFHVLSIVELSGLAAVLPASRHGPNWRGSDAQRSAGRALSQVELRIIDDRGQELPRGVTGELVARGPTVMLGYLDQPDETAAVLRHGWLHTGITATMDVDGYLHL